MSRMYRIFPRRKYEFGNLTAGTSMTITGADRIDLGFAVEVELIARLHSSSFGVNNTIAVNLVYDFYDSNDPGNIYVVSTNIASVSFSSNDTAPTGKVAVGTAFGPKFAAIQIVGTRSAGGGAVSADISVDVNMKVNGIYRPAPHSFMGYMY